MMPAADPRRIRRIRGGDGPLLRTLRLKSLADAPEAFGQSDDEARARPDSEWHRSARQASKGNGGTWYIAEVDGSAIGLVHGRRRRPSTLLVFSMWVDTRFRGCGLGRDLIGSAERWAHGWNATETVLWVFSSNAPALSFYRRLGFAVDIDGDDAEAGARYGALALRRTIQRDEHSG